MNIILLKEKMKNFFSEVEPEILVKQFEQMGYKFEDKLLTRVASTCKLYM